MRNRRSAKRWGEHAGKLENLNGTRTQRVAGGVGAFLVARRTAFGGTLGVVWGVAFVEAINSLVAETNKCEAEEGGNV